MANLFLQAREELKKEGKKVITGGDVIDRAIKLRANLDKRQECKERCWFGKIL